MRKETMTVKEFMNRDFKKERTAHKQKIVKYSLTIGSAVIFAGFGIPDLGFAASEIDAHAAQIYKKLLSVGKWIIIVKGAIETINNTLNGDSGSAKKSFLSYLVVYLMLKALPWAMNEVDAVFTGIEQ